MVGQALSELSDCVAPINARTFATFYLFYSSGDFVVPRRIEFHAIKTAIELIGKFGAIFDRQT